MAHRGRAGRRIVWKELGIGGVESAEVARIGDPARALDHVGEQAAGSLENGFQVPKHLPGLCLDPALDHRAAAVGRHLAGDENQVAGPHCPRERQLRTAAGAELTPDCLFGHRRFLSAMK
jgi:hypothetical protein